MKMRAILPLSLATALLCAVNAQAQTTSRGYPAYLYDVLDPWQRFERQESLIASGADVLQGRMALFEPVDGLNLPRHMTGPIGRLEIKRHWRDNGQETADWCTAFLVSDNLAITNNHCLPGLTDSEVAVARVRFNYLRPNEGSSSSFIVSRVVESDPALDYAVIALEGTPGLTFGTVPLLTRPPLAAEPLNLVGHPNSFPQRVTRALCRAAPVPVAGDRFKHSCDTYGASSGSPIFSETDGALIALHASGEVEFSDGRFNQGVLFQRILDHSALLRSLAISTPLQVIRAPTPPGAPAAPLAERWFSSGVSAYRSGDFENAVAQFRRAAEVGHPEAAYNLAAMYDYGRGVARDYAESRRWYVIAAEAGSAPAMYNVGGLYYFGLAGPCDPVQAASWYHRAAERGNSDAKFSLGVLSEQGNGLPRDFDAAVRWYESAARDGAPDAHLQLGRLVLNGSFGPQDYARARRHFQDAARLGHPDAFIAIAEMYERGLGGPVDLTAAQSWRRQEAAARAGRPELTIDMSASSCPNP